VKDHLDGPGFVAWLEDRGKITNWTIYGDAILRTVHRCKVEQRAISVWHADEIMVHLGFHLHELPEELWVERPPRPAEFSDEIKQAVLRAHHQGESSVEISQRYGPAPDTVRRWAREEKVGA
jgi:hypothetical protein